MPFNNGANRLKSGWRAASPKRTLRLRGRSDKSTGRGRGNGISPYPHNRWIRDGRRRSLLGGERGRLSEIKYVPLANLVMVTALKQIEMDVTIVIGIGAVTEYGRETSTRTLP